MYNWAVASVLVNDTSRTISFLICYLQNIVSVGLVNHHVPILTNTMYTLWLFVIRLTNLCYRQTFTFNFNENSFFAYCSIIGTLLLDKLLCHLTRRNAYL